MRTWRRLRARVNGVGGRFLCSACMLAGTLRANAAAIAAVVVLIATLPRAAAHGAHHDSSTGRLPLVEVAQSKGIVCRSGVEVAGNESVVHARCTRCLLPLRSATARGARRAQGPDAAR